jgi:hypothetical protein
MQSYSPKSSNIISFDAFSDDAKESTSLQPDYSAEIDAFDSQDMYCRSAELDTAPPLSLIGVDLDSVLLMESKLKMCESKSSNDNTESHIHNNDSRDMCDVTHGDVSGISMDTERDPSEFRESMASTGSDVPVSFYSVSSRDDDLDIDSCTSGSFLSATNSPTNSASNSPRSRAMKPGQEGEGGVALNDDAISIDEETASCISYNKNEISFSTAEILGLRLMFSLFDRCVTISDLLFY